MTARRIHLAVVGGSEADDTTCRRAEAVGEALARRGAVLVCGGLGGVMEAACRGAQAGGGTTLGILPGADRRAANPFVDVVVPTGMGEARNALVVLCADALVAVGGEFGTLSEIAFALKMGTPVVGLESWRLEREGMVGDPIQRAGTPSEAVARALGAAGPV